MHTKDQHPDDAEFRGRFDAFPLSAVAAAVLATLAAGWLAVRLAGDAATFPRRGFESSSDVRAALARAIRDPAERVVVLLGDSVLRGEVMAAHGIEGWERETVGAHCARLKDAAADVSFYDLSFDGMLPMDMLSVLRLLAAEDPSGRVEVVVEMSGRYLSAAYAEPSRWNSRAFLRPRFKSPSFPDPMNTTAPIPGLGLTQHRLGLSAARLALLGGAAHPARLLVPKAPRKGPDAVARALHRGRVLPHFAGQPIGSAPQLHALGEMADQCEREHRRALFFVTPINEDHLVPDGDPGPLWARTAALWLWTRGDVTLRHFDDHLFPREAFLDHCHLRPEGNRRLARRILQSLDVPLASAPPAGARPRPVDSGWRYVLGDAVQGHRDGFGPQVRFGASVAVTMAGPGTAVLADREHGAIRWIDLRSGCARTVLDRSREATKAFGGEAFEPVAVAHGGETLFVDRGTGAIGRVMRHGAAWPLKLASEPPWRGSEVSLAPFRNRWLLYDRTKGRLFRIQRDTGEVTELADLPDTFRLRDLAVAGDGATFLLDDRGNIWRTFIDALERGDVTAIRRVARSEPETASSYWKRLAAHQGLNFESLEGDDIVFSDPSSLCLGRDGHVLFVGDRIDGCSFCWRLNLDSLRAYPVLAPGRDGLVLPPEGRRLHGPGRWLHDDDDGSLYLVSSGGSLVFRLRERLLQRHAWTYGAPPDPTGGTIVRNGYTYPARAEGAYRIGLLGSSLIGGTRPGEVADFPAHRAGRRWLFSSLSLAMATERRLRGHLGETPHEVQVVDLSSARATLIEQYVTLVSRDPDELHQTAFFMDRGTLDPPATGPQAGFGERWARLVRDERGMPRVGLVRGYIPAPVFRETAVGPVPSDADALEECLTEMVTCCRRRGIRPVFADLTRHDDESARGLVPRTGAWREGHAVLVRVLRSLDVPRLDPFDEMATTGGDHAPLSMEGDRHLTPLGLEHLGGIVAAWLRRSVSFDLFRFDELEAARHRARRRQAAAPALPPRLSGPPLSAGAAAACGVALDRTQYIRDGSRVTVVVELRGDETAEPWRAALAGYGLRGAARARRGDAVSLRVIRYRNFDEYGRGVSEGVAHLGRFDIRPADLGRALGQLAACIASRDARRPDWLGGDGR